MKKITVALLVLALAAMSVVNCFAADISTAVTDLDLVYFDDFSDASKYDYTASEDYIAEISDATLFLQCLNGTRAYILPGAPELSGLTKATFVMAWTYEAFANMKMVGVAFNVQDGANFNIIGNNVDVNNGLKSYYSPITEGSVKRDGANMARYGYVYSTEDTSNKENRVKDLPTTPDTQWVLVAEYELGTVPTFSWYWNGEPVTTFMGAYNSIEYDMATDASITFDGVLGLVNAGAGIYVDGVAVYGTTGLDHRELVAKISSESVEGSSTPSAPAETEPAPAETEPAPAETEPAPAETEPTPVETAPVETEPTPAETEPTPAETDPAPAEGGCGGVIGVGAIVAILGCAVVLKKKD